ncbi:hypothetical protein [Microvirga zambiensis]|uniref:hypothetical protein n=1 Tax=Microvirga zambiensis TaxID=1402137 RepID=UPI00191D3A49|nr:hypothetical protein [Microvirga zambiensis]
MSIHESLSKADKDTLKEICRNAESYLSAQLTSALAANQRAMTFTGLLAAATVVLGGAGGTLVLNHKDWLLGSVCFGIAAAFLLAMAIAMHVAKPIGFEFVGNSPAQWVADVENGTSLEASLAEQCHHYAGMIDSNNTCMELGNKKLIIAMRVAWGSLLVGGIAALVLLWMK